MKCAIISGGSKGLGRAFVHELENTDFQIVEFSRTGSTKYNVRCDFSDYDQASVIVEKKIASLAEGIYSDLVLINNVGTISPIGPIGTYSPAQYASNVNVNFLSSILLTGTFAKHFQSHACRKTIIAMSSGAAIKPKHGWSLYCGVKAGLEMFYTTFSIEQSVEDFPIHAVLCDPGIIDTDMQKSIREASNDFFPEKARFIHFKKEKMLKTPESVAKKILEKCNNTIERYIRV